MLVFFMNKFGKTCNSFQNDMKAYSSLTNTVRHCKIFIEPIRLNMEECKRNEEIIES